MSSVQDVSVNSNIELGVDTRHLGDVVSSIPTGTISEAGLHNHHATPAPRGKIENGWPLSGELLVTPAGNRSPIYLASKRMLDILGASVLLVLLSSVLIVTFLVLLITTKGRPLFAQQRVGFCGRRFWMFKFLTMRLDAEAVQQQVANEQAGPIFKNRHDPRITRIGRILRKLSIDEMPQLINVLRGEMSLVGPRPPIAKEVAQYEPWQRQRLSVKPGLTCLWQVSGRSDIGFEQWMRMDLWYVAHQTLWTDFMLLVRTPMTVLTGRGAY